MVKCFMPRRLRIVIPSGVYHVTNRGVDRSDIVREDRERFAEIGSHARQSVGGLRSEMQIPRSGDRGNFARPEVSPDRRSRVEDNDPTMHSVADRR